MHPPLIGILTQEATGIKKKHDGVLFKSYIPEACVRFAKDTGARVIPILIDQEWEYYDRALKRLNCVIFPGGATFFNSKNERNHYREAGAIILEIAKNINDGGVKLPIFGICLGMQLLIYLTTGKDREECEKNRNMEAFQMDPGCKMFSAATQRELDLFKCDVIEYNSKMGYTIENTTPLDDWKVVSSRKLQNGNNKIIAIESLKYPFYGVQFHPEKPEFEPKSVCPDHLKADAVEANRFFVRFLEESLTNKTVNANVGDNELIDFYEKIDAYPYSTTISGYYVFN